MADTNTYIVDLETVILKDFQLDALASEFFGVALENKDKEAGFIEYEFISKEYNPKFLLSNFVISLQPFTTK